MSLNGCLESFLLLITCRPKIADLTHSALMQPNACLRHFVRAFLDLVPPEGRTVTFQPLLDLTQLRIHGGQAHPCFRLKLKNSRCEPADGFQ
jgi:hypothetical protein